MLPAPPGTPYISSGCSFYVIPPSLDDPTTQAGNVDWSYLTVSSTGFGELTNTAPRITDPRENNPALRPGSECPIARPYTDAERIACSNYVFIFIDTPYSADPASGSLALPEQSLEYASNDNADALDYIQTARDAIDADYGAFEPNTQIIVALDAGSASVVNEVLAIGVDGLFIQWGADTKAFLDVAFGINPGLGTLPVGLPASDSAAAAQDEDVPGDGQHSTFVRGFGLTIPVFD